MKAEPAGLKFFEENLKTVVRSTIEEKYRSKNVAIHGLKRKGGATF